MKTRHTQTRQTGNRRPSNGATQTSARDEIIDWLRDAYAMERALEGSLEKQALNDNLNAETRSRAASHLEETRNHAEQIRSALRSLGSETGALKTGLGILAQTGKGVATAFAKDEGIKDLLDAYSMEHFEIACYTALAAAADLANLPEIAGLCHRIIVEEQRMADALKRSLPIEVKAYLSR
jgi:ferritin-like metal-binding protein YciE